MFRFSASPSFTSVVCLTDSNCTSKSLFQEGWLSPAYFPLSSFAKHTFKKNESVSFFKKELSSANFDNFSKFKIFLISAKNPQFRWKKKQIYGKISFDYTANLPFYFFFKKIRISYVLRNLYISVAFYGSFAIILWLKTFKVKNGH